MSCQESSGARASAPDTEDAASNSTVDIKDLEVAEAIETETDGSEEGSATASQARDSPPMKEGNADQNQVGQKSLC